LAFLAQGHGGNRGAPLETKGPAPEKTSPTGCLPVVWCGGSGACSMASSSQFGLGGPAFDDLYDKHVAGAAVGRDRSVSTVVRELSLAAPPDPCSKTSHGHTCTVGL
jgi:hypothetical protein